MVTFPEYKGTVNQRNEYHGYGKLYNKNGELIYEGEFKNGKRHGKGKLKVDIDGKVLFYEGEFENGELKETFRIYDVALDENDKYTGYGKLYNDKSELIYAGEFKNGKFHGRGIEKKTWYDTVKKKVFFNGNFKNGIVTETFEIYDGALDENGKYTGYGKLYDGEIGKLIYEGEFKNGQRHGKGKEYSDDGKVVYEGAYKNGSRKKGTYALHEGYYFKGTFKNNIPDNGQLFLLEQTDKHINPKYNFNRYGDHKTYDLKMVRTDLKDINNSKLYISRQVTNNTEFDRVNVCYLPRSKKSFIFTKYISKNMEKYYNDNNRILKSLSVEQEVKLTINGITKTYTISRIIRQNNNNKKIIGLREGNDEIFYYKDKKLFYTNCNFNEQTCICSGPEVYVYDYEGRNIYIGGINENGLFDCDRGVLYNEDHKLIYEGGFIDGRYDGFGMRYTTDDSGQIRLIYKGEIKNGKCHGKGKLYFPNGKIRYEGEYLNGKRHGKGKEYNEYGDLIRSGYFCEGEFCDKTIDTPEYEGTVNQRNEYHGYGKLYDKNGNLIYEGEFLNGLYNGQGKNYLNGKIKYEGQFVNGRPNGVCKEYDKYNELVYYGEFTDGQYNGEGTLYKNREVFYRGEFNNDTYRIGDKTYNKNHNLIYEGAYLNGRYHGQGIIYYPNGEIRYNGQFEDGKMSGKGKEYDKNGKLVYDGHYLNGQHHGKGKEYDEKGNLIYEGEFVNGVHEGNGIKYDNGIKIYEGGFYNNVYHGEGREYNIESGQLMYEGTFENGELSHGKRYNRNGKLIYTGEFRNTQDFYGDHYTDEIDKMAEEQNVQRIDVIKQQVKEAEKKEEGQDEEEYVEEQYEEDEKDENTINTTINTTNSINQQPTNNLNSNTININK